MIITYCTDTYYRWAVLFLKSWRKTNNNSEKIHINTLNFNDKKIDYLKSIYDNLIIENEVMTFKNVCKRLDIDEEEFEQRRILIREGDRTGINRHVISFFASDKRVKNIWKTVNSYKHEPYFIQCDIDLLFRYPIPLEKWKAKSEDAGLRFKLGRKFECRKINIGFMFLKNNEKTVKLINDWRYFIDSEPLEDRTLTDKNKIAWGQYPFYQAYMKNPDLECFNISDSFFDNKYREPSHIWSANKRIKGNKTNTYLFFRSEYEKQ
jgi:hypothetical protein